MADDKEDALIPEEKNETKKHKGYIIKSHKLEFKVHHVYFHGGVGSVEDYIDILDVLGNATSSDEVIIYLSSPGGRISTGAQLINSIRSCEADVNIKAVGPCHSMGALLALSGDSLEMDPHSYLMFHNYSGGYYGKGGELRSNFEENVQWIHGLFKDVLDPFLTQDEISTIINDQDIYIHWDDKDLKKRLKRHFTKQENK